MREYCHFKMAESVSVSLVDWEEEWGICITTKPFKFSVLSTAHVRNLGAHAYRKFNAANILVV